MQTKLWIGIIAVTTFFIACTNEVKDKNEAFELKKSELAKLKAEKEKIDNEIDKVQEEMERLNPDYSSAKPKLVSVMPVSYQSFEHYINLQGKVGADNISFATPRGMPAQVKAIYIKKGDYVKKGQTLLKLDDAVQLQQIAGLKTQLAYAEDLYKRTSNLWKEGIGTEVQLITAENNVKALKDQMRTLETAWEMSNVKSEVNGYVEELNLRVGEVFTGFVGNMPQIMIVNPAELKVVIEVPENYIDRIKKGSAVSILLPDVNLEFNSTISLMNQSVGLNSRTITTEAKISHKPNVRINQVAIVRIMDYSNPKAIVIPLTVLQTDEKGKYVYVMGVENGKEVAVKKPVTVGEMYGDKIEVLTGLAENDQLISQGYQGIYNGQTVTTK